MKYFPGKLNFHLFLIKINFPIHFVHMPAESGGSESGIESDLGENGMENVSMPSSCVGMRATSGRC